MFGMKEPENRAQAEFFIKYIVMTISALWLLWAGTTLIVKEHAKLNLRNAKLSSSAFPTADHKLKIYPLNELSEDGTCIVTGKYILKNTGEIPFAIDKVILEVYAYQYAKPRDLGTDDIISITVSNKLNRSNLILTETINGIELVGVDNQLQRLFGYYIKPKKGYGYTFSISATGGLPAYKKGQLSVNRKGPKFNKNDLKHLSGYGDICHPIFAGKTPPKLSD